ncbi:ricin-type beta-trefoil lectin domain protein [Kitasatospora sp. NPDC001527]|uniref:ricin-type beta-trefoil lectin domain protein n=1 Tax=Kitasatospora sp. NPDC001527 TaxID=3154519 RepID=UPI00332099ED
MLRGPLARRLAPLCAVGLVLAAPGAAFADAPSAADAAGYAQAANDLGSSTPTGMNLRPKPSNPDGDACGGGTPGWIGRTVPLGNGTSDVRMSAWVGGVPAGNVVIGFHVWDTTAGESGESGGSWPTSQSLPPTGGWGEAYVGRALQDGHQYGWNAWTTDGTAKSPVSANCAFNVDLTAPTLAAIAPSPVFPPLGSGARPTGYAGDRGVTVRVTSKDPLPAGCTGGGCLASGVRGFQYSLDDTSSPTGTATVPAGIAPDGTAYADVPISVSAADPGSHTLYVRAVDGAGNTDPQAATYSFFAPSRPGAAVPGDATFDGVPDYLAPAADGSLTLFPGGSGSTLVRPETASTADRSPRGDDWNNYLLAHRGAVRGSGDSLFAYNKVTKQLFVYTNDANELPGGVEGHFTRSSTELRSNSMCELGIDRTWNHVTQLTAVRRSTGGTGLVTVEQGHLRYYPSSNICQLGTGVELGAAGGDWSGFTLMHPGEVNGAATLWVRDTVTGAVTGLPLPLDAAGQPVSGFAPLTPPAHKPLEWGLKPADGTSVCADIDHGWTGNGTAALLWTCAGQSAAPNQQFTLGTDGSLHVLGKCLDVTGGATASGSPVNLWDCNGSPAQKWVSGPYPRTLQNPNSGRCLDVPGTGAGPGSRLVINDCSKGAAGAEWSAPAARAVLPIGLAADVFPTVDSPGDMNGDGYPDLVADVYDGRLVRFPGTAPEGTQPRFTAPQVIPRDRSVDYGIASAYNAARCLDNYGAPAGGSLRLYDCWNGANQQFAFGSDGTLRTGGRCVTVQNDVTHWGEPAVLTDCRAGTGQIWTYRADGTLHNPAANACLELPGWNDANGTSLGIWGCNGNANQRWMLLPSAA